MPFMTSLLLVLPVLILLSVSYPNYVRLTTRHNIPTKAAPVMTAYYLRDTLTHRTEYIIVFGKYGYGRHLLFSLQYYHSTSIRSKIS